MPFPEPVTRLRENDGFTPWHLVLHLDVSRRINSQGFIPMHLVLRVLGTKMDNFAWPSIVEISEAFMHSILVGGLYTDLEDRVRRLHCDNP